MSKYIKSELFFLKQFGFSEPILQKIYLLGLEPLDILFNEKFTIYDAIKKKLTVKDKELLSKQKDYKFFKHNLYIKNDFLHNDLSKICFKYDENELTNILPNKIMPLFMYLKGDVSLLSNDVKKVAIVGTRNPSKKTIYNTRRITEELLSKNYVIISGLAKGVDTISHETTILNNGKTIAVLPTNFDNIYPKENVGLANKILKNGLLVTSIGPNENTYKSTFLDRNRYVANISDIVLVMETNLKSGTMNTIRNASEANKRILFIDQKNNDINNKIFEFGGEMINESIRENDYFF